jgi:hypothetical protein
MPDVVVVCDVVVFVADAVLEVPIRAVRVPITVVPAVVLVSNLRAVVPANEDITVTADDLIAVTLLTVVPVELYACSETTDVVNVDSVVDGWLVCFLLPLVALCIVVVVSVNLDVTVLPPLHDTELLVFVGLALGVDLYTTRVVVDDTMMVLIFVDVVEAPTAVVLGATLLTFVRVNVEIDLLTVVPMTDVSCAVRLVPKVVATDVTLVVCV